MRDRLHGVLLRRIRVATWRDLTLIDQVFEYDLIISHFICIFAIV